MAGGAPARGRPDGRGVRLAIVTATFHPEITGAMRDRALKEAQALGAKVVVKAEVPGSYDLPLAVDASLARRDVDAAVALGAVVSGETGHDEMIAFATGNHLTGLALKHGKPVGLGVTGPRQTYDQAQARVDRADAAVRSAIAQFRTLATLAPKRGRRRRAGF